VSIQGQETLCLSLFLRKWVQVRVAVLKLSDYILHLLKLNLSEPGDATVRKDELDKASAVYLRCLHSHLLLEVAL